MKMRFPLFVLTALAGGVLAQANLGANDKKKTEPAKPFVVNDQWINADLKDKVYTESHRKSIPFKMEKDKSYLVEVVSRNRACVRLETADGAQLAADIAGGNQAAAIVHYATKTEDYQIIVTALNPNINGKFTMTIKELTGDEGKPIGIKLDKGLGTYKGRLAKTDPRYNGKVHKLFVVEMEEGKTYQVDHMSKAFDAFLYLQGPDGAVLAEDDDGGVGLNSRIVHKAGKAGEYRIVATSLDGRSTGEFTFMVEEKK